MQVQPLEDLIDVGIALSSTHELSALLQMILSEARRFTRADAGTLYLVRGGNLCAEVGQNQTLAGRLGSEKAKAAFTRFSVPVTMDSVAGAAAVTRDVVHIEDVQNQPAGSRFRYNPGFDREHNYSTHSNLAVPMKNRAGDVVGVLQLINAMENGRVTPFSPGCIRMAQALASQAAVAVQNALLTEDLRSANLESLRRLGVAAEWRDKETANHIMRVSHFAKLVGRELGMSQDEQELLFHASAMHDVGKVGIPDAILNKPGRLSDEERAIMERHCEIGADILKDSDQQIMQMSLLIAFAHHEKWNGTGYPRKLAGEVIPLEARIVAMVDVYDALSSKRCYKEPFPEEKVLSILREDTGRHFDPRVSEAFFRVYEETKEIRHRFDDSEASFEKFAT